MSEWDRKDPGKTGPIGGGGFGASDQAPSHALERLHSDPRIAIQMYRRIQLKRANAQATPAAVGDAQPAAAPPSVQQKADGAAAEAGVHQAAAHGLSGTGGALPHFDAIQKSFGKHDVSHVQAHTDGAAAAGASAMGAEAYATGNQVAFASTPTLHTTAHEAAHVVQQRGGVQLKGGVGEAGDPYEQHADAVADRVVAGEDAAPLLDRYAAAGHERAGAGSGVQRKPSDVAAFDVSVSGNLAAVGAALRSNENVARMFAQIFPGRNLGGLDALIGLTGIATRGDEANTDTQVTVKLHTAQKRVEFEIKHAFFHMFLNELAWEADTAEPNPTLILHKWERDTERGGGAGLGLHVFDSMRAAAAGLGMSIIVADAIGNAESAENGYYTWPRFGFNNNSEGPEMATFKHSLGELYQRIETRLPEIHSSLGGLIAALPNNCPTVDMSPDDREARKGHLLHQKALDGGSLSKPEEAELTYIRALDEAAAIRAESGKYGAALEWVGERYNQIATVQDLFLKAENKTTRTQLASLWKQFGDTLRQVEFDLAADSGSNKVLSSYKADLAH